MYNKQKLHFFSERRKTYSLCIAYVQSKNYVFLSVCSKNSSIKNDVGYEQKPEQE